MRSGFLVDWLGNLLSRRSGLDTFAKERFFFQVLRFCGFKLQNLEKPQNLRKGKTKKKPTQNRKTAKPGKDTNFHSQFFQTAKPAKPQNLQKPSFAQRRFWRQKKPQNRKTAHRRFCGFAVFPNRKNSKQPGFAVFPRKNRKT